MGLTGRASASPSPPGSTTCTIASCAISISWTNAGRWQRPRSIIGSTHRRPGNSTSPRRPPPCPRPPLRGILPCHQPPRQTVGRRKLEGVARSLRGSRIDDIAAVGHAEEAARSERLARGSAATLVPPRQTLAQLAALAHRAQIVVGVDTGLTHLAAAIGTATIAIFAATDPRLAGVARVGAHATISVTRPGRLRRQKSPPRRDALLQCDPAMLMRALYAPWLARAAVAAGAAMVARPSRTGLSAANGGAVRALSYRRATGTGIMIGCTRSRWAKHVPRPPLIERLLREYPDGDDPVDAT